MQMTVTLTVCVPLVATIISPLCFERGGEITLLLDVSSTFNKGFLSLKSW